VASPASAAARRRRRSPCRPDPAPEAKAEAPRPRPAAGRPGGPGAAGADAAPARNFLPTGYAARLDLDPASPGFEGAIRITGNVSEKSLVIWLNARGLTVHKASRSGPGSRRRA